LGAHRISQEPLTSAPIALKQTQHQIIFCCLYSTWGS